LLHRLADAGMKESRHGEGTETGDPTAPGAGRGLRAVADTRVVKAPAVEPGATAPFSVAGAAGRSEDALRCVLRYVQFS